MSLPSAAEMLRNRGMRSIRIRKSQVLDFETWDF